MDELASAVAQLVEDYGPDEVTAALHDALVQRGRLHREHAETAPQRLEGARLSWMGHLVGNAAKVAAKPQVRFP